MKRIAIKSNYDSEFYFEKFLNVPAVYEQLGAVICEELNKINPDGPDFYALVPLDYRLCEFEP